MILYDTTQSHRANTDTMLTLLNKPPLTPYTEIQAILDKENINEITPQRLCDISAAVYYETRGDQKGREMLMAWLKLADKDHTPLSDDYPFEWANFGWQANEMKLRIAEVIKEVRIEVF